MRLTILKDDHQVYVDGFWLNVDCSSLPDGFHALQWYEDHGEIEWVDTSKPHHHAIGNERITDISAYQHFIDSWTEAKKKYDESVAPYQPDMDQVKIIE